MIGHDFFTLSKQKLKTTSCKGFIFFFFLSLSLTVSLVAACNNRYIELLGFIGLPRTKFCSCSQKQHRKTTCKIKQMLSKQSTEIEN